MSSVMVLGVSNSGKTVYGAQLYGRMRHKMGALELRHQPKDIRLLKEAFHSLATGQVPTHTSTETYGRLLFPLKAKTDGSEHDVLWPDYGGEQFAEVLESRTLNEPWQTQVKETDGLLLLIRPSITRVPPDVLSVKNPEDKTGYDQHLQMLPAGTLPTDGQYVEMLQLFTDVRNLIRAERYRWPLVILLSCWDELKTDVLPAQVLESNLPLLSQYLKGAWHPDFLRIMGLSALGRELIEGAKVGSKVYDEDFINSTPQTMGQVITENGKPNQDLTLPLSWLLEQTAHAD